MEKIGVIDNYFSKVGEIILYLTDRNAKKGDKIIIKGKTTDFMQFA